MEEKKTYYERNKAKCLERQKKYNKEKKEEQKQYYKQYWAKNKKKMLEKQKAYRRIHPPKPKPRKQKEKTAQLKPTVEQNLETFRQKLKEQTEQTETVQPVAVTETVLVTNIEIISKPIFVSFD